MLVEHGHRLLGAAGRAAHRRARRRRSGWATARRWVRGLGLLAVVLVCRRRGSSAGCASCSCQDALAIVHGCLAQLFFALLVGIAVVTGRAMAGRRPSCRRGPGGWRPLGRLAAAVVYGQIVLGAFTTHGTAVWWHVAGAVVATVRPGRDGPRRPPRRRREDPVLAWWARAVKVLARWPSCSSGVGAYVVRFTSLGVPGRAARRRRPAGPPPGRGRARPRERGGPRAPARPPAGAAAPTCARCRGRRRSGRRPWRDLADGGRAGRSARAGRDAPAAGGLPPLAKPRVVLMVVLTTLVGYYLGASADLDLLRLVHLLVGTALAAGGHAGAQPVPRARRGRADAADPRAAPAGRAPPAGRGGRLRRA